MLLFISNLKMNIMKDLVTLLRKQGYDLIDGPTRGHKVLQIWLKKDNDKSTFLDPLGKMFTSSVDLVPNEDPALFVDSTSSVTYSFKTGLTALDQILKSANLGDLGLDVSAITGSGVSISYNNARTVEYSYNNISNYFCDDCFDFKETNPEMFEQVNRNHFLLITGVLYAKDMEVRLTSSSDIDASLAAKISTIANANLTFSTDGKKEITMKSKLGEEFPIAVKAFRLEFDKGRYQSMRLLTDHRGDLF
jgi:hypothetical protein